MPQGDKKSTFQIWKVKWPGVEFIAKINLTNDDADFLVCAWLLAWISSIAETVTIARLSNPGKHTDKTYRELTDELIKNMKLWKFTNNDPDWYATVYLEKIVQQYLRKDHSIPKSILDKLSQELWWRVSDNDQLILKFMEGLNIGKVK